MPRAVKRDRQQVLCVGGSWFSAPSISADSPQIGGELDGWAHVVPPGRVLSTTERLSSSASNSSGTLASIREPL